MKRSLRSAGLAGAILAVVAVGAILFQSNHASGPGRAFTAAGATADIAVAPAGNGIDQADALQATLDALQAGQRLVLAPGTYVVGRVLNVRRDQVVVSGYGATLVATNPDQQAIFMTGTDSTLVGVTLVGVGTQRLESATSTKVAVDGQGIQVLDVTVQGGASVGIFVSRGSGVALVGNKVQGTLADGIHITGGSRDVLVQSNAVTATGDDMVGIVSYLRDDAPSRNIYVTGNYLAGNAWGRGVAVVGGADVTVTGNVIEGVQKAASVMVSQEDSYRTANASNVLVSGNAIADDQDAVQPGNSRPAAGHGAIELDSGSGTVTQVLVTGNQVTRTGFDGFRALGNICGFRVTTNRFASIGGTPLSIQARNCAPQQMICDGNTLDGAGLAAPPPCAGNGTVPVTGADATRLPVVRASLRQRAG